MPFTTKVDGNKLRRLREARGLTLTQLAEAAGIQKKFLSKIECSADRNGSPLTRLKIAQALGVQTTDFTYEHQRVSRAKQAA